MNIILLQNTEVRFEEQKRKIPERENKNSQSFLKLTEEEKLWQKKPKTNT